jgi:hypothetical protein
MGRPFGDITLYSQTPHSVGTQEYNEETSLQNYICDLYCVCMHGYKPPNTTRVCIQTAYNNIWDRTWKNGSLVSAAAYFNYDDYSKLTTYGKYNYILVIIHQTMLQLSSEYNWDKLVFEKAYNEIIANNFSFKIEYPIKLSKDKKKLANIVLSKTETKTIVNISFEYGGQSSSIMLFEKKNWWWYDAAYKLAKGSKWFDDDRFGLSYKPYAWSVWYSIKDNEVTFEKDGVLSNQSNIEKVFTF